jgi:hypothetical protein
MPRLEKGAKWVFGWVIVGPDLSVPIPPAAWRRYRFEAGGEALLLAGSRTSGGLALAGAGRLPERLAGRIIGSGRFEADARVMLDAGAPVHPGDRLLAVFGSGHALGLLARGPIFRLALEHDEIEVFR